MSEVLGALEPVLARAAERCRFVRESHLQQLVSRVKRFVRADLRNASLKTAAAAVSITPIYLSYAFKKQTGENFKAFLTRERIECAKRLLRTSMLRVQDIVDRRGATATPSTSTASSRRRSAARRRRSGLGRPNTTRETRRDERRVPRRPG